MKEKVIKFYVNKFCYMKTPNEPSVDFIPPIIRRRMSKVDKYTLSVLNSVCSDEIENIVFSSCYGEVERLEKLINQYTENKEVSPNTFTGSVHNYPVGFYLLNIQKPVPYTALSAGENSISAGLLSATVSDFENIVFCYSDYKDDKIVSLGLNISKNPVPHAEQYNMIVKNSDKKDNFEDYIEFFDGKNNSMFTSIFLLERVNNER